MRWLERRIILDVVDSQWKDHLLSLDHLKEGIGLRGYAQKDPIVEFKKEAFTLFEDMMARIDNETIRYLFHIQVQQGEQPPSGGARRVRMSRNICRPSRGKSNDGSSVSKKICSIRRGRRKRNHQSR